MPNKQSIIISLSNPCHENWDKMTTNEQGRHCSMCNKTVVDFSLYSDKQLIDFFKNANSNICGHIPKQRLDTEISVLAERRFPFLHKLAWGTAIASWFGFALKTNAQTSSPQIAGKIKAVKPATGTNKQQLADDQKNVLTLTLLDASSKKSVEEGSIFFNNKSYYCNAQGVCSIPIPANLTGSDAAFYFSGNNYEGKDTVINLAHLPMNKKIYLTYHERHIMVNGGLTAHNPNVK